MQLSGSNPNDPDNYRTRFTWVQTGGTPGSFTNAEAAETLFTPSADSVTGEVLTITLTVENCAGELNEDTVLVKVLPEGTKLFDPAFETPAEGGTVDLSGGYYEDTDDPIVSVEWRQISGADVYLFGTDTHTPYFVTPPCGADGQTLVFGVTLVYQSGFSSEVMVPVTYADNGITGFDDDVLTFFASTGSAMGILVEGGFIARLTPVDPDEINDDVNRPGSLIFRLAGLELVPGSSGGEVTVTFVLSEALTEEYGWYIYNEGSGWSEVAVSFSEEMTEAAIVLTDGGTGDADSIVNSIISITSGPGSQESSETDDGGQASAGGGGGGGCFIEVLIRR